MCPAVMIVMQTGEILPADYIEVLSIFDIVYVGAIN